MCYFVTIVELIAYRNYTTDTMFRFKELCYNDGWENNPCTKPGFI